MNMVDERGATPAPIKAIVIAVVASLLVMVTTLVAMALLVNHRADVLAETLDRAEVKDDEEAAYEEGLKRYICALPAPPEYTDEQTHLRDQFCDLPPQINLQKYLDEHS